MNKLWAKVVQFLAKVFGVGVVPPEVYNADAMISLWWDVFRGKAPWIPFDYVTSDGIKRNRKRLSLGAAKIACAEMAGLVLAEEPEVNAGPLVDEVLKRERFWDNERQALEYQGALGGQVLKLWVQSGASPRVMIDFVKAHNFIPHAWDNSEITEASFLDRRVSGGKSIIRVETHRKQDGGYVITNKAYDESTSIEVPLSTLWPDLEPETVVLVDEPLFVYVKNPEANNFNADSPLGISLFANAIDTVQAIDIAFDGFKTEMVMGRQRVAIPSTVARGYIDPETGKRKLGFDPTDEAYIRLEGDDASKLQPTDLSGQLRVEQWRMGIQTLLDLYATQTGFSAGTFSFDGESIKTATEVVSENSKTYKTMQAYRDALDFGLKHLFRVINKVGALYKIPGAVQTEPSITWDDSVIEDRNSRARYYTDLSLNKLIDKKTALMRIHGIDEAAAEEMAAKIKDETKIITDAGLFTPEPITAKEGVL